MSESLANLEKRSAVEVTTSSTATKAVTTGTPTTITSMSITKGKWLLIGECYFPITNGMNTFVMVLDSESETIDLNNTTGCRSSTSGSTYLQKVRYYEATANTTIYLRANQNSSSSLSVSGSLTTIKIGD